MNQLGIRRLERRKRHATGIFTIFSTRRARYALSLSDDYFSFCQQILIFVAK